MLPGVDADAIAIARQALLLESGDDPAFDQLARRVFEFQIDRGPVYARFAGDTEWSGWRDAPYLPIQAFKEAQVTTFPPAEAERVFASSATGRAGQSRHYVRSLALYRETLRAGFGRVFGPGPFVLLAHLPHYVEQGESSSLLYMVEDLLTFAGADDSGFFLEDRTVLERGIKASRRSGTPLVLFGAAFGLLDLLESSPVEFPENAIVIETGGMKTHRREIRRAQLHAQLAELTGLPRDHVFSEYGMAELLSQCYSTGGDLIEPPPWVRAQVVDPLEPSRILPDGEPGALAVFDLANVYTTSAILTQDLAVMCDGRFDVLGRLSQAELRGCNFLMPSEHVRA